MIDPSQWTTQARFAKSNDWTGLSKWQTENCVEEGSEAQSTASSTTSSSTTSATTTQQDDLTRIRGIGPATQKLLRRSGVTSFELLNECGTDRLQQILTAGGSKFSMIDPSQWTTQARFAKSNDWTGLSKWQTENCVEEGSETQSTASSATSGSTTSATTTQQDDLTKIRGIGPATQELLRKSGITTFAQLNECGTDRLQQILNDGGTRFAMIDPSLWTKQARFAMNKDWAGLTQWQSQNCIEESPQPKAQTSPVSYQQTTASGKPDDLTRIRGIGPATQRVLRSNGIQSFDQIASMTSDEIGNLFADEQTRFSMLDTTTWPSQAREFVNERSGSLDAELGVLDEVNSIRCIASTNANSKDTGKTTSGKPAK